jgi:hypothetical protein
VGNLSCLDEEVGHALRWWIKRAAALLRNAAAGVGGLGGLPLSLATIWLIDLLPC